MKFHDLEEHEQKAADKALEEFQGKVRTIDTLSFIAGWLASKEYRQKLADQSPPPGIYRGEFPIEDV